MDSGLSGTVTCDVTVTDPKGLQDTGTITLTINAINDYDPKFPQRYYTFFLTPTDTFLTRISDISAYDNDSTNDALTYSMANGKSGTPGDYFQIDAAGILYVRDVSSFQLGSTYYFDVIATDATAPVRSGTTQIFIIFSSVSVFFVSSHVSLKQCKPPFSFCVQKPLIERSRELNAQKEITSQTD